MTGDTYEPYRQDYYPPVPTGFTKYRRTAIVWQFVRFVVINIKILKVMTKSMHGRRSAR